MANWYEEELADAQNEINNLKYELAEKDERIKELEEGLKYYADDDNWMTDGRTSNKCGDGGVSARITLANNDEVEG